MAIADLLQALFMRQPAAQPLPPVVNPIGGGTPSTPTPVPGINGPVTPAVNPAYGIPNNVMGPPSPAVDPARQSGGIFNAIRTTLADPNFRAALMTTGANLLRSPGYGQGAGDVAADAITTGIGTLQGLRQQQRQVEMQQQKRADEREDALARRRQAEQQIDINRQQVEGQIEAQRKADTRGTRQLTETERSNRAREEIERIRAEADRTRANAYRAAGIGRTPQDIQKINMLAAQYMAEGMDETAAKAKAVMVVESTGRAKSPGEQARSLYEARLKAWQNDFQNFGKTLTAEQAKQMLEESMNDVMYLHQFNQTTTGMPGTPRPTQRSGPIQRPGDNVRRSPVGTIRNGYKKIKEGPDTDQTTWQKVNDSGE